MLIPVIPIRNTCEDTKPMIGSTLECSSNTISRRSHEHIEPESSNLLKADTLLGARTEASSPTKTLLASPQSAFEPALPRRKPTGSISSNRLLSRAYCTKKDSSKSFVSLNGINSNQARITPDRSNFLFSTSRMGPNSHKSSLSGSISGDSSMGLSTDPRMKMNNLAASPSVSAGQEQKAQSQVSRPQESTPVHDLNFPPPKCKFSRSSSIPNDVGYLNNPSITELDLIQRQRREEAERRHASEREQVLSDVLRNVAQDIEDSQMTTEALAAPPPNFSTSGKVYGPPAPRLKIRPQPLPATLARPEETTPVIILPSGNASSRQAQGHPSTHDQFVEMFPSPNSDRFVLRFPNHSLDDSTHSLTLDHDQGKCGAFPNCIDESDEEQECANDQVEPASFTFRPNHLDSHACSKISNNATTHVTQNEECTFPSHEESTPPLSQRLVASASQSDTSPPIQNSPSKSKAGPTLSQGPKKKKSKILLKPKIAMRSHHSQREASPPLPDMTPLSQQQFSSSCNEHAHFSHCRERGYSCTSSSSSSTEEEDTNDVQHSKDPPPIIGHIPSSEIALRPNTIRATVDPKHVRTRSSDGLLECNSAHGIVYSLMPKSSSFDSEQYRCDPETLATDFATRLFGISHDTERNTDRSLPSMTNTLPPPPPMFLETPQNCIGHNHFNLQPSRKIVEQNRQQDEELVHNPERQGTDTQDEDRDVVLDMEMCLSNNSQRFSSFDITSPEATSVGPTQSPPKRGLKYPMCVPTIGIDNQIEMAMEAAARFGGRRRTTSSGSVIQDNFISPSNMSESNFCTPKGPGGNNNLPGGNVNQFQNSTAIRRRQFIRQGEGTSTSQQNNGSADGSRRGMGGLFLPQLLSSNNFEELVANNAQSSDDLQSNGSIGDLSSLVPAAAQNFFGRVVQRCSPSRTSLKVQDVSRQDVCMSPETTLS